MIIDEIRNGESAALEFKRSMPEDALKVLKTACAFANCSGGRIVVGVADDRTSFRYMRFIESWGSGIPRIQRMLLNWKLKPLTVEDNGSDMRFIIWRPASGKSLVPPVNPSVNPPVKLTKSATRILGVFKERGSVTYDGLVEILGLHRDTVRVSVRHLVDGGYIRRVGSDRTGCWEVIKEISCKQ